MNIQLKAVTRENWEQALNLKVRAEQKHFVPTVAVSLAKIYIKPDGEAVEYIPFSIYAGKEMVGFIMHAYEINTSDMYWINGFIIDAKCQRKGYGRAAINEIICWITNKFSQCREIRLTVHIENGGAYHLYKSLGFTETGQFFGEEKVMKLVLN